MSEYDLDDHHPLREEPDCYTCGDGGTYRPFDAETGLLGDETNCPECNPTEGQRAEQDAAYERDRIEFAAKVARGEASYDDSPF